MRAQVSPLLLLAALSVLWAASVGLLPERLPATTTRSMPDRFPGP